MPSLADILKEEWKGNQRLGDPATPSGSQASPQAPTGLGHSVSIPIADRDRELLALEYERGSGDGPYPTYADLARRGVGAFTLCSLRAIARARAEGFAQGIEARRAETQRGSVEDESPVPAGDAPNQAYVTIGHLHGPITLTIDIEGEGAAEVAKAIQALPELVKALKAIARQGAITNPRSRGEAARLISVVREEVNAALAKAQP